MARRPRGVVDATEVLPAAAPASESADEPLLKAIAVAAAYELWVAEKELRTRYNALWLALDAASPHYAAVRVMERLHHTLLSELHRLQWELTHPGERYQ
jgi:hypothetical protein